MCYSEAFSNKWRERSLKESLMVEDRCPFGAGGWARTARSSGEGAYSGGYGRASPMTKSRPTETEGQEANPANSPEFLREANAAAPSPEEVAASSGFLYLNEL
jgi:hypothetical protein